MDKIEKFGFNTTKGKCITLKNATLDEIADKLMEEFPTWTREVAMKIANNPKFHADVKPLEHEERKDKKTIKYTHYLEPIVVGGCEVNELLRACKSLKSFCTNSFGQFGITISSIFGTYKISSKYGSFDKVFKDVDLLVKEGKVSGDSIINLCRIVIEFTNVVKSSGLLVKNADEEYICGTSGKVGLNEIIDKLYKVSCDTLSSIS